MYLQLCNNILHYFIKAPFSKEKVWNIKCVFWFSVQLLPATFLILRRTERDIIINVYKRRHVKCTLFFSDFNETWIFSTYIPKTMKYQISWNLSSGSQIVACGRTDIHDQVNNRYSQFCERVKKTVLRNDAVSEAADIIEWSHLLALMFMIK